MTTLRYRKRDPGHNVIVSVARFIESRGGRALVIGGIELEHIDGFRFRLAVPFSGRAPSAPSKEGRVE